MILYATKRIVFCVVVKDSTIESKASFRSKKTITLEKEIERALRRIQAQLITSTDDYWSLSNVLNIVSVAGIISSKKIDRAEIQKIKSMVKVKRLDFDQKTIQDLAKKIA